MTSVNDNMQINNNLLKNLDFKMLKNVRLLSHSSRTFAIEALTAFATKCHGDVSTFLTSGSI